MTAPGPFSLRIAHGTAAQPDAVFAAFTDPEQLMEWWGPPGFTAPGAEVDLRVGGAYRLEMLAPDGDHMFVKGVFREILPPRRLVMTWEWEQTSMDGEVSTVTVEFRRSGKGTAIDLLHEGFSSEDVGARHQGGWEGCLASLDEHLAA